MVRLANKNRLQGPPELLILSLIVAVSLHSFAAAGGPGLRFENLTGRGLDTFIMKNSPNEQKHLPETMAGGVAAFDYDGDGLTDIFFANGAAMPSLVKDDAQFWNRLYRNEGGARFFDVTAKAGVQGSGYSIGA